MIYILGGSGALGRAIIRQVGVTDLKIVNRIEYLKWVSLNEVTEYFKCVNVRESDSFFVCAGITNPKSKAENLDVLNFQIPKNILIESQKLGNSVFTFGSVHESTNMKNPYLESKNKLLNYIYSSPMNKYHKHLQLHTIYGTNLPKKHMLLGQIYHSIKTRTKLKISSGRQLREFWHADDVAEILMNNELISKFSQIGQITSGKPLQIINLVSRIFTHFNLLDSFEVGGIEDSLHENYDNVMKSRITELVKYQRDQFSGVISYLEECLSGSINKF